MHPTTEMHCEPDEVEEDARAEPAQLLALPVAQRVEPLKRDEDDADRQLPEVVVLLIMGKVLLKIERIKLVWKVGGSYFRGPCSKAREYDSRTVVQPCIWWKEEPS